MLYTRVLYIHIHLFSAVFSQSLHLSHLCIQFYFNIITVTPLPPHLSPSPSHHTTSPFSQLALSPPTSFFSLPLSSHNSPPFPPHDSLSLSNTQPLYLSHVSCELQSHVSRVSSASNRAGQLCLVLLTDRNTHTQTHTSQQSPVWDYTPGHTLASPYFQGRDRNAYTNAQIKMHINIHNSRTNPVTHTQGHRIYNAVFLIEHN